MSLMFRTTTDTLGLIIATDIIKKVTLGDYTSYTMKIIHENDSTVFYNLTIEYKNGKSGIFVTKYTPTAYWLDNKDSAYQGNIQSRRMNTLEEYIDPEIIFDENLWGSHNYDVGIGIGGGGSYVYNSDYPSNCLGTVVVTSQLVPYQCSCEDHWPGDYCTCPQIGGSGPGYNQILNYACVDNGSYDPYNPPDDTGGSTGGISTTDPDPDDGTSIAVLVKEDEEPTPQKPKTKCQSLKQLVQNDSTGANILPIVNSLRTKLSLDKEWSVSYIKKWSDGNMKSVPEEGGIQEGISLTRSKFKSGNTWVGQIHTHPNGTYSVFSWLDLKAVQLVYTAAHNDFNDDIFLMAVAPNNVTYALKVDDIQALTLKTNHDWENAKGNDDEEKRNYLEKIMIDKYKKSDNLEQAFLELYENYGVSFYKATDANLTNWKLLELDEEDEETVNETLCN